MSWLLTEPPGVPGSVDNGGPEDGEFEAGRDPETVLGHERVLGDLGPGLETAALLGLALRVIASSLTLALYT